MILQQYVRLLMRWWWLIVLSAGVAGAAAYLLSREMAPIYAASTTLLINPAPVTNAALDLDTLRASTSLGRTYSEMLRRRPVLEAVIADLQLTSSARELAQNVTVTLIPNTQLIMVTVEDTDPQRAADIANGIVRAFTAQNQVRQAQRYTLSKESLEQELIRLQSEISLAQTRLTSLRTAPVPAPAEQNRLQALIAQYTSSYATVLNSFEAVRLAEAQATDNLEIVEEAQAETTPQRPTATQNALLAALLGALVALGIAVLIDYLDDSIRSSEEVERLINVDTLATIGRISGTTQPEKLVTLTKPYSEIAEDYRLLRTKIEFAIMDKGIRTLMVTSSDEREGKSIILANLAIALAQTGKRVILVDTNLRRPTLHEFFGLANMSGGITTLLQDEATGADYLTPSGINHLRLQQLRERLVSEQLVPTHVANLCLLTSGPLPANPAELLGSQLMLEIIEELKTQADVVLFDSPPVLAVVDAMLLARVCDMTLLVVQAGVTRAAALRKAKEQLLQAGANLAGVVLNGVATSHRSYQQPYQNRPAIRPAHSPAAYNPLLGARRPNSATPAEPTTPAEPGKSPNYVLSERPDPPSHPPNTPMA